MFTILTDVDGDYTFIHSIIHMESKMVACRVNSNDYPNPSKAASAAGVIRNGLNNEVGELPFLESNFIK